MFLLAGRKKTYRKFTNGFCPKVTQNTTEYLPKVSARRQHKLLPKIYQMFLIEGNAKSYRIFTKCFARRQHKILPVNHVLCNRQQSDLHSLGIRSAWVCQHFGGLCRHGHGRWRSVARLPVRRHSLLRRGTLLRLRIPWVSELWNWRSCGAALKTHLLVIPASTAASRLFIALWVTCNCLPPCG